MDVVEICLCAYNGHTQCKQVSMPIQPRQNSRKCKFSTTTATAAAANISSSIIFFEFSATKKKILWTIKYKRHIIQPAKLKDTQRAEQIGKYVHEFE